MIAAFTRAAVALALLPRLTAGAKVCGRVPDCVIDVGRACAREHLPLRVERAAAAKVVAARNAHDVDDDGCYRETVYAGEAREMAKTLIEHKNSKSARRFKRLREELSSRTAGRDL